MWIRASAVGADGGFGRRPQNAFHSCGATAATFTDGQAREQRLLEIALALTRLPAVGATCSAIPTWAASFSAAEARHLQGKIMSIESELARLQIALPQAPAPVGAYKRVGRWGDLYFLSGQFPFRDGGIVHPGHLGVEVTTEQGYEAARICALNCLAQVRVVLGSLDRLDALVRVEGHVNCGPGFTQQAKVLDGASDLFAKVLGEHAGHARTAFGHNEMPLDAPVELVITFAGLPDRPAA
jgi:enamine deaminase RidA (YjgF/YER057c/UK114 family)